MLYNTPSTEFDHHDELPLEQQFAQFVEDTKLGLYVRRWLHDPASSTMAYVRENERPIGPPIRGFFSIINGQVKQYASTVHCLEIANLEYRNKVDAVSIEDFKDFLSKIYTLSPWNIICLDQIGAPEITEWCVGHGWETDEDTGIVLIRLPEEPNIVLGTAKAIHTMPAYPELPVAG